MTVSNSDITFASRNHVIRKADDIARAVQRQYPMLSPRKLYFLPKSQEYVDDLYQIDKDALAQADYPKIKQAIEAMYQQRKVSKSKYQALTKGLEYVKSLTACDEKWDILRSKLCKTKFSSELTAQEKVKQCIELIKQYKMGNCSEHSNVAMILANLKKIKGLSFAELRTQSGKDLDHVVLYAENNKKPYIIDAWLGFADYTKNAVEKYKTIYSRYFPTEEGIIIEKKKNNIMGDILDKISGTKNS